MPEIKPNQNEGSEHGIESFPLFSPSINFLIKEIISLGGYDDLRKVIDLSEVPPLPILEARVREVREEVYRRAHQGRNIN